MTIFFFFNYVYFDLLVALPGKLHIYLLDGGYAIEIR